MHDREWEYFHCRQNPKDYIRLIAEDDYLVFETVQGDNVSRIALSFERAEHLREYLKP